MPWSVGDVDQFKKGLTDAEKKTWVKVANDRLAACLKEGRTDCEASAIKQANGVVAEAQHEHESLGDRIVEAALVEGATFKATIQGFLRAAMAVTRHPNIPAKVKKQVDELRDLIGKNTWADLAVDSTPTQEALHPSEGIREALQSIARRQVRSRLREMDLGNYSVGEFETKLNDALGKIMPGGEFRILDIYEGIVIFAAAGGMWGARYTVGFDGSITLGKPFRVKRICRYVPDEEIGQEPEKPIGGEQDDQDSRLQLPEDWWKYTQDWGNDGEKVLGSTVSGDTQGRGTNEAMREDGSIVTQFVEDGALVSIREYSDEQPRDEGGKFAPGGGGDSSDGGGGGGGGDGESSSGSYTNEQVDRMPEYKIGSSQQRGQPRPDVTVDVIDENGAFSREVIPRGEMKNTSQWKEKASVRIWNASVVKPGYVSRGTYMELSSYLPQSADLAHSRTEVSTSKRIGYVLHPSTTLP